ncbi:putative murein peptide carboxypeptidase [Paenibacillus solanacearum]|uniref:Murein peptide carboxypeptidase n=1 Tax=Paenibacillus solanacearum TaxID=2048548 RepID=A0A916K646_9BACL|nr:LD-carboxypeptidase [Paenibacillus solanacearum]CAG7632510.1 putative murein peptide carboxypeptidase [Paenibacillus solanacearum]
MAIKPPLLRQGDTIGIVTLGSPLAADVIDDRVAALEAMGFKVVLGEYVYASDGFLAGTDQERASDFMSMIHNPEVKLILPARGGVGVAGILPYLDFQAIARNPKLVTGYSDITVLLNALYQFANLITLHSLLLISFSPKEPEYNFTQFFEAASVMRSIRPILNPPGMTLAGRIGGSVYGPVVGGNVTSFVDSIGTPFEIDTRGKILLLEETDEPINRLYRMIKHLQMAGKFDDCAGIVMGQCTNCAAAYGQTYEDLINETIVPLGKPLLTNMATGHGAYKAAIPIGAMTHLDADAGTLTVVQGTVSP